MRGQIEPVNAEIVKDETFNLFELRSDDPVVIPVRAEARAHQPPDQSRLQRLANEAEMWRPPSVLIDGQPDSARVGQVGKSFADIQVDYERLLAQNVFARVERCFNDFDAVFRARRDVNDLDLIAPQQLAVIGRDQRVGIKLLLVRAGFAFCAVAQRGHSEPRMSISVQMLDCYAATADDADRGVELLRILRMIRQDGRFDPRARPRFAQTVIVLHTLQQIPGLGKLCHWVSGIGYWVLSCEEKTHSPLLDNGQYPIPDTQWPRAVRASSPAAPLTFKVM